MTAEFKGIQLKRSTVASAVPEAAQLVEGELAINLVDKKLYSKNSSGVFQVKGAIEDNSVEFNKLTTGAVSDILKAVYPVGSIYINAASNVNPATLLGFGTWTEFGAGRVIVGLNSSDSDFDALEETGGAKTITPSGSISGTVGGTALTEAQMPKHWHNMSGPNSGSIPQGSVTGTSVYGGGTPDDGRWLYGTYSTGGGAASGSNETGTGNGEAHTHSLSASFAGNASSVVQPYITVRMWKRTA